MRSSGHGPRFDAGIAPGGYAWWYVDALSADGRHGLSVIALLGSVFSPYYARARRAATGAGRPAGADPLDHCAINVALYGAGGHRWAMTERRRADVRRDASHLQIGPSALSWDGETLTLAIEEITAPWPSRIRGTVRVRPHALFGTRHLLDGAGRHRWQPIAPRATVEVELDRPGLRWQGPGYFDCNDGDAPLEDDFDAWTWSRTSSGDGGETVVFYDVERAGGGETHLALAFDDAGGTRLVPAPPVAALPRTPWGIPRPTRSDAGSAARVVDTLEDGPFYARSVVGTQLAGQAAVAMHESLSLRRFRQGWVRMLLPFKMPRPPPRQVAPLSRPSDASP